MVLDILEFGARHTNSCLQIVVLWYLGSRSVKNQMEVQEGVVLILKLQMIIWSFAWSLDILAVPDIQDFYYSLSMLPLYIIYRIHHLFSGGRKYKKSYEKIFSDEEEKFFSKYEILVLWWYLMYWSLELDILAPVSKSGTLVLGRTVQKKANWRSREG